MKNDQSSDSAAAILLPQLSRYHAHRARLSRLFFEPPVSGVRNTVPYSRPRPRTPIQFVIAAPRARAPDWNRVFIISTTRLTHDKCRPPALDIQDSSNHNFSALITTAPHSIQPLRLHQIFFAHGPPPKPPTHMRDTNRRSSSPPPNTTMLSFAPTTIFAEPWDHRPSVSSPLSSSPIRASSPLSPVDRNALPQRQIQSSPIQQPKFKFASRPVRQNPLLRKREDLQDARRKNFLQSVRQKADEKAWQRRDVEGQVSKKN